MKKPASAGFLIFDRLAGGLSEHPEKHQQQDDGDGDTE
jgi:hypothetical protein